MTEVYVLCRECTEPYSGFPQDFLGVFSSLGKAQKAGEQAQLAEDYTVRIIRSWKKSERREHWVGVVSNGHDDFSFEGDFNITRVTVQ